MLPSKRLSGLQLRLRSSNSIFFFVIKAIFDSQAKALRLRRRGSSL